MPDALTRTRRVGAIGRLIWKQLQIRLAADGRVAPLTARHVDRRGKDSVGVGGQVDRDWRFVTLSGAQADLGDFEGCRARPRLVETGLPRRAERLFRLDLDRGADDGSSLGIASRRQFQRSQVILGVRRTDFDDLTVAHDVIIGPLYDVWVHIVPEDRLGLFGGRGLDDDKRFLSHVTSEANFPFHVGFSIGARCS
jgi:hypothetical protein